MRRASCAAVRSPSRGTILVRFSAQNRTTGKKSANSAELPANSPYYLVLDKNHLPGILSYFTHRITNAIAEGTNSKIEWIKNTARGYRNWDNLKAAIFFHCGGLNLSQVSLRPA